jgi:hypothetical protein
VAEAREARRQGGNASGDDEGEEKAEETLIAPCDFDWNAWRASCWEAECRSRPHHESRAGSRRSGGEGCEAPWGWWDIEGEKIGERGEEKKRKDR